MYHSTDSQTIGFPNDTLYFIIVDSQYVNLFLHRVIQTSYILVSMMEME